VIRIRDCKSATAEVVGIRLTSRSAATILSLLEEGSFDYSSIFTDQAG
jgi:hypothetical protein